MSYIHVGVFVSAKCLICSQSEYYQQTVVGIATYAYLGNTGSNTMAI